MVVVVDVVGEVVVVRVVEVEVVVVLDELSTPTTIVTVVPFLAVELPPGVWLTTTPLLLGLVTARVVWCTFNPAAVSALTAPAAGSPTTLGTVTVGGAVATVIVTPEPLAALVLPAGLWLITLPTGTVEEAWFLVCGVKPARVRSETACVWVSPTTDGTCFCAGPEEMNRVTVNPRGTSWPTPGLVAVAWPAGKLLSARWTTFPTFSPARCSALVAAA